MKSAKPMKGVPFPMKSEKPAKGGKKKGGK